MRPFARHCDTFCHLPRPSYGGQHCLNEQAFELAWRHTPTADDLRIAGRQEPGGPLLMDFGIDVAGGLEAGLRLAEICLAGQARVDLVAA